MNEESEYDVSIILPCYQEEKSVEDGIKAIFEVMKTVKNKFEVIFTDDGSTDKTREKILKVSKEYPHISYLFQDKNTGRGRAFINGSKIAKGKIIGFLDVDMEVSVSSLPKVINEIEKGNDVVIVNRKYPLDLNPEFIIRHLASIIYKNLVWFFLKIPKLDTETGFKFFKRNALLLLVEKIESERWFFDTEIICLAYYGGFKVSQVDGIYKKNPQKTSTVNLFSDSISQFFKVLAYRKKLKYIFPR